MPRTLGIAAGDLCEGARAEGDAVRAERVGGRLRFEAQLFEGFDDECAGVGRGAGRESEHPGPVVADLEGFEFALGCITPDARREQGDEIGVGRLFHRDVAHAGPADLLGGHGLGADETFVEESGEMETDRRDVQVERGREVVRVERPCGFPEHVEYALALLHPLCQLALLRDPGNPRVNEGDLSERAKGSISHVVFTVDYSCK